MSVKQGAKYDSPDSVKDILPFIEFHRLDVDEILDPLDSFST
jgi:phosphatidylserine decarboxylase